MVPSPLELVNRIATSEAGDVKRASCLRVAPERFSPSAGSLWRAGAQARHDFIRRRCLRGNN